MLILFSAFVRFLVCLKIFSAQGAARMFTKRIFTVFIFILLVGGGCFAQNSNEIVKIEANPAKGFSYSYYLYVPAAWREFPSKQRRTILVIPNNSGVNDDLSFHDRDAKRRIAENSKFAAKLDLAVLMPVFPRPKTDWNVYTHALDRDAMLTGKKEFKRFELQLARMIADARRRLSGEKIKIDERVLMLGFSASGMFVNRFAFLHPEMVKAAAIGSPGGWAIAPVASFEDKTLRYPIGTSDFKAVSGAKFNLKAVRRVPLFMFLGDQDDNDSVIFGDSYESEDKDLIFALFGETPVKRWEISRKIYEENKLAAKFKLYPNVKHTISKEMRDDIEAFFKCKMQSAKCKMVNS